MSEVLIIGATSDVGREIARRYAKAGYDVVLTARDEVKLKAEAEDLSLRFGSIRVTSYPLDVRAFETHQDFVESLDRMPDGVIAVVGYLGDQQKAQREFEEAKAIIETNYTGIVSLLEKFADRFAKRRSGFIVGISSVAGERGRKSNYIYGSAKAGFTTYLSGLRNRLHDLNIQVLSVIPGFIATKMTAGMDLPPKLTAQPEEVAEAIFSAQQKGKDILYTKSIWRVVMAIIRAIPEWQFKKMSI